MTTDDLREPEELLAYYEGTLGDAEAVAHIRASEACKNWMRDYRLLKILGSDHGPQPQSSTTNIAQRSEFRIKQLSEFMDEKLSSEEMRMVEGSLATDPDLFDEYMSIRMEQTAAEAPPIPQVLKDDVLKMLLDNAPVSADAASKSHAAVKATKSGTRRPEAVASKSLSDWLVGGILEFTSPRRLAWAGGLAAVLLVAVVGNRQINGSDMPGLMLAAYPPEVVLKFRGAGSQPKIPSEKKALSTKAFEPDKEALWKDFSRLSNEIGILSKKYEGLVSPASYSEALEFLKQIANERLGSPNLYEVRILRKGERSKAGKTVIEFSGALSNEQMKSLHKPEEILPLLKTKVSQLADIQRMLHPPTVKLLDGALVSVVFRPLSELTKALTSYEAKPNRKSLSRIVALLNEPIDQGSDVVIDKSAPNARFDTDHIDAVQIHPSLATDMLPHQIIEKLRAVPNNKPALRLKETIEERNIAVSVIEVKTPKLDAKDKSGDDTAPSKILYFSNKLSKSAKEFSPPLFRRQ